jgi:hypothetical protein
MWSQVVASALPRWHGCRAPSPPADAAAGRLRALRAAARAAPRKRAVVDPGEQVGHGRERELRLGRGRPAPENQRPSLLRPPARLAPERCLADPRVALEHQGGESSARRVEEGLDLEQLRFAANDPRRHGGRNCTRGRALRSAGAWHRSPFMTLSAGPPVPGTAARSQAPGDLHALEYLYRRRASDTPTRQRAPPAKASHGGRSPSTAQLSRIATTGAR